MRAKYAVLAVILSFYSLFGPADAKELGDSILIGGSDTLDRQRSTVANLGAKGFVVVWYSELHGEPGYVVYGQRFTQKGKKKGDEFRISNSTVQTRGKSADVSYRPSVSRLDNGGFVVSWTARRSEVSEHKSVYARIYAKNGMALGSEFLVSPDARHDQQSQSTAGLPGGGFVVAWSMSDRDGKPDVVAQRFTSSGKTRGALLKVGDGTYDGVKDNPSVAALNNGGFVIVYEYGSRPLSTNINAQVYGPTGKPMNEFQVNSSTGNGQYQPIVVPLRQSKFIVAWVSRHADDVYMHKYQRVLARIYKKDGADQFGEVQLFDYWSSAEGSIKPTVAGLSGGRFVAVWGSFGGCACLYSGITGQLFTKTAQKDGGEFRVTDEAFADSADATVSPLGGDDYVVSWTQGHLLKPPRDIIGQRFTAQ